MKRSLPTALAGLAFILLGCQLDATSNRAQVPSAGRTGSASPMPGACCKKRGMDGGMACPRAMSDSMKSMDPAMKRMHDSLMQSHCRGMHGMMGDSATGMPGDSACARNPI